MATGRHSITDHKLTAEQASLVRSALESVISSDAFAPSERCQDFLRLVVEHALAGDLDSLRERMIGVEMFGRRVDYDTSTDPPVRIELPSGSYVPEFHWSSTTKAKNEVATTMPRHAATPRSRHRL